MKKLVFLVLAALVIMFLAFQAEAASVDFAWYAPTTNEDGSELLDLAEYRLYASQTAGSYAGTPLCVVPAGVTSCTLSTTMEDTTGYFVVTAVDDKGNESIYSNEVSVNFPGVAPASPTNLRVVTGP